MTQVSTPPSRILLLVAGFVVWSSAFIVLYGVNAIGCAFNWVPLIQRSVLVALFLVHIAVLVSIGGMNLRHLRGTKGEPDRMISFAGLGLTIAALASTVFVLIPSLFVTMCV